MKKFKIKSNYDGMAFKVGEVVTHIGNGKYKATTRKNRSEHYREGWVENDQIEKV